MLSIFRGKYFEIQCFFWKRMWTMKQRYEKKMERCMNWEVTAHKSTTVWSSHRANLTFKRLKDTEGRFRKGKQMISTPICGTITDKEALTCDLWDTYASFEFPEQVGISLWSNIPFLGISLASSLCFLNQEFWSFIPVFAKDMGNSLEHIY